MVPTTSAAEQKEAPVRAPACKASWEGAARLACEMALLALVGREFVRQALLMPQRIAAPFQFDYEEGNILNALARITHGLSPYPDPHAFPNVLNPYGPAAYYVLAGPVKLLGISFAHARMAVVASVVAICALLALTIVRLGGSRMSAVAFGLMFPTLIVVQGWTWLLRVDLLALVFSLAGVYVFCGAARRGIGENAGRSLPLPYWVAAALLVAAIFVKYTFLAAPAACVLYLMIQRRWKEAGRFVGIGVGLSGGALAITAGLTRGTIFTHLFLTHPDPFSWQVYLLRTSRMFALHRPLVALAAALIVSELLRRRVSVPVLWLVLATGSAVTAGKLGSGWNHYLEWSAVLCLGAGLGFSVLTQLKPQRLALAAAAAATLWAGAFMLGRRPPPDPFAAVQGCGQAYAFVKQQAGERILAENVGALVLAGKTVWVSNLYVLNQLVMRKGWSDKPLEDMLRQRQFDALLLNREYPSYPYYREHGAERFSPQLVRAMGENYRLAARFKCEDAAFVYVPVR